MKVRKPRPGAASLLAKDGSVSLEARRQAVLDQLGRARVAFRDITNCTNSRTVLACLVPPDVLLANTAPYLAFAAGGSREQAVCLGLMNSLAFDWQARRFVEGHVSFFLLEGLYLPELVREDFESVAAAAARLFLPGRPVQRVSAVAGVGCGPLEEVERQRLRVEIDARVARAWELDAADLRLIFTDFTEIAVPLAYRAALIDRFRELA